MREFQISQSITNRDTRSVETYLNEVGKLSLIGIEEEVLLAGLIRQGDEAALQRLVKTNLRFVVSVAKKYQNQGMSLSDLISEGNLGLIKAAQKYDETRGFKFISYAVWWIRQSIMSALTDHMRLVRLPMNKVNDLSKIYQATAVLEQELLRKPSSEQLAEYLDMSVDKVNDALMSAARVKSLDAPLGDEDDYSLYDALCDPANYTDEALMAEDATREVGIMLSTLSERERTVLSLSFGLSGMGELLAEDIADQLGITTERVRQIRKAALLKLRNAKKSGLWKKVLVL